MLREQAVVHRPARRGGARGHVELGLYRAQVCVLRVLGLEVQHVPEGGQAIVNAPAVIELALYHQARLAQRAGAFIVTSPMGAVRQPRLCQRYAPIAFSISRQRPDRCAQCLSSGEVALRHHRLTRPLKAFAPTEGTAPPGSDSVPSSQQRPSPK